MSNDSLDQHQYQQAKEARELEAMINQLGTVGSGNSQSQDVDLLRLGALGVDIPKPQAPVEPPVAVLEAPVQPPAPVAQPLMEQVPSSTLDQGLGANYWREQAETLQRRKAEADRALAPSQQKAARYEKAFEETHEAMALLLKEVQGLKNGRAPQAPPETPWYDPSQDAEFASVNPEMAQRLAYIAKQSKDAIEARERAFQERLDALQAEQNRRREQEELDASTQRAAIQYATIKQAHPDVDEFAAGTVKGQALWEWATGPGMPPEYQFVVLKPANFSAEMVIQVLNFFKNSSTPAQPQRRSPSLADIANPVLASSSSALSQPVTPVEEFLTPDQMKRAESILNSEEYRMDPAKANAFMEKMIRTEMRNAQSRS